MPDVGLVIRGVTGRLLSGCRLVATLWSWEAHDLPGHRRLSVMVGHVHRDPVWWDHHSRELVAELDVGNRIWRGRAVIVGGGAGGPDESLALEIEGVDIV